MKKTPFFLVFVLLIACYIGLDRNNAVRFDEINRALDAHTAIKLDASVEKGVLAKILENNGYVNSKEDAQFVTDFLIGKLTEQEPPQALLDLNKRIWQVPAAVIEDKENETFLKKLMDTEANAGWGLAIDSIYRMGILMATVDSREGGDGVLTVKVKDPIPEEELSAIDKIFRNKSVVSSGVVVRLDKHRLDAKNNPEAATIAYAMTDKDGVAKFTGLAADSSYSVLPVKKGLTYGSAKGTYLGSWGKHVVEDRTVFEFSSTPLAIRMFPAHVLVKMRDDATVIVRTPDEFTRTLNLYTMVFMGVWLLLFIIGNTGPRRMDNMLAAVLMLITGLSMFLMFSINDPMTGRVLGVEMAQGSIIGAGCVILLLAIDIRRFFQEQYFVKFDVFGWLFEFFGLARLCKAIGSLLAKNTVISKLNAVLAPVTAWLNKIPGKGYLYAALLITAALWVFGEQVGGMTVNLNLGFVKFQPSEIAKYWLIIFMAAFFFEKGESVIRYSLPVNDGLHRTFWMNLKRKFVSMGGMLFGLGILLLFYAILSDMGPALVVSLTFIFIYSLMKSKAMCNVRTGRSELSQLLHSDLSLLIVGILTFLGALAVGKMVGYMGLFAMMWLAGWIAYGYFNGRQFHESAVMFNIIVAFFVFGEDLLPSSIGERLAERNSMAFNTWGTIGGEPGVNTQVAEGLWALASGGFTGQGLGNAQAQYIPAYHTDMVLQSIGELLGFFGIVGVILLLSVLLRRAVLTGYRSGHRFILYLCAGIAIVTGIQFFIISLGSLGIIPLTGVTVPFFSFGRVSLILNIFAFGIVLSASARLPKEQKQYLRPYNDTIGILTMAFSALTLFVMAVVAHYQIGPRRDATIIRPVYVYDTSGAAVVKYNPRIEYVVSKMRAGDIYDRNGVLLATSNPAKLLADSVTAKYKGLPVQNLHDLSAKAQRRYYPFGEHMFFMVGDANRGHYFSSVDYAPFGYLAEARHMSEMRGFDNRLFHEEVKDSLFTTDLVSDRRKKHRFMPEMLDTIHNFQLRDYSVLLPFVKQGYHSQLVKDYNDGKDTGIDSNIKGKDGNYKTVKPQDIQLTVDAALQMKLQQLIPEYFKDPRAVYRDGRILRGIPTEKYRRYERFSIVVMDAVDGDLLASANWPLPDEERFVTLTGDYNDGFKPLDWTAFTERDLGLTNPSNPGSTAKIMSALAGLVHLDNTGKQNVEDLKYKVYQQVVHKPGRKTPLVLDERIHVQNGAEPLGWVSMKQAITESSNCYFINLVNDKDLYDELATVYGHAGLRVLNKDPYKLRPVNDTIPQYFYQKVVEDSHEAVSRYRNYVDQRDKKDGVIQKMRGDNKFAHDNWTWAWGEGTLDATPVAMARIAAIAATGNMPVTRFRMDEKIDSIQIVKNKDNINKLRSYMIKEANQGEQWAQLGQDVGGKTGTPERGFSNDSIWDENYRKHVEDCEKKNRKPLPKEEISKSQNKNDGWYICFIDGASTQGKGNESGKLAVAVRVERVFTGGSGYAKDIVRRVVIPALKDMKYIRQVKPEAKK